MLIKELFAIVPGKYVLPRIKDWDRGEQACVLRTFCVGIGLPPVKFHTLRACYATTLMEMGVAPITVMKLCGWKELKTMQTYILRAGLDIQGTTRVLDVFSLKEATAAMVDIFSRSRS